MDEWLSRPSEFKSPWSKASVWSDQSQSYLESHAGTQHNQRGMKDAHRDAQKITFSFQKPALPLLLAANKIIPITHSTYLLSRESCCVHLAQGSFDIVVFQLDCSLSNGDEKRIGTEKVPSLALTLSGNSLNLVSMANKYPYTYLTAPWLPPL